MATASLVFGEEQAGVPDFGALSLDQLANIKITSFTRKQQKLSQVAGAVYVITQEQIARSGLTSVPELLRLAPGIDVARVNGNQWSISARGTVGIYSNKLLVMLDGRSLYSPIFAGVYWELGMPMMEDIDRIEVIRGPGATIWGANAVLGVINIITKSSRDTQGTTVTTGVGTSERVFGNVRMGGKIGTTSYRAYFGGADNQPLRTAAGGHAVDGWATTQAGFRLDGTYKQDKWLLEGDVFRAPEDEPGVGISPAELRTIETPGHFTSMAGNLAGEWRRRIGETGELRVQSYYDYANRPVPQAPKVQTRTWDTGLQYNFTAGRIHNLSLGGGERLISAVIEVSNPNDSISFTPNGLTYSNVNGYAQDEIHFLHDSLLFTAGAKIEHNHFGGWGPEPSVNLLWMPTNHQSLWVSAARSLRTPTLFEQGIHAPFSLAPAGPQTGGLPVLVYITGSPAFSTESVKDIQAGYRTQISKRLSADVAFFYDRFSDIRSYSSGYPSFSVAPAPHLEVSEIEGNGSRATGKGAEGSVAWEVMRAWKLEGSYTYNALNSSVSPTAVPGSTEAGGKLPARTKWRLQSYMNLSKAWKLDTFVYWTSAGSPTNFLGPSIEVPSYTRLDIRLGYKAGRNWQLSLAGQNLLESRHIEAVSEILTGYSYVNRAVYLKSTWQF